MPEFLSFLTPQAINTFFLAVFFAVVVVGCWRFARFMAPLIRARFEKATQAHEAQATLATSLVTTIEKQTDIANAMKTLLGTQGEQLMAHGHTLGEVAKDVGELKGHVGELRDRMPHKRRRPS